MKSTHIRVPISVLKAMARGEWVPEGRPEAHPEGSIVPRNRVGIPRPRRKRVTEARRRMKKKRKRVAASRKVNKQRRGRG